MGTLTFTQCPKTTLPAGFGGFRDKGTYIEMFTLCKEFGWSPQTFLDQDPFLLSVLLCISQSRNLAESAKFEHKQDKSKQNLANQVQGAGKSEKKDMVAESRAVARKRGVQRKD